jgi:hypothetical protein
MKTDIYKIEVGDFLFYRRQKCFGKVLRFETKDKIIVHWDNDLEPTHGYLEAFAEEDFANNYLICETEEEKFVCTLKNM